MWKPGEKLYRQGGFFSAIKTFSLSTYKNNTCSIWNAKKAQKNSRENRNKIVSKENCRESRELSGVLPSEWRGGEDAVGEGAGEGIPSRAGAGVKAPCHESGVFESCG